MTLLGASLGGAVALDFAATHPECADAPASVERVRRSVRDMSATRPARCVDRLILMDAGGESYAQPDPFLTSLAADPAAAASRGRYAIRNRGSRSGMSAGFAGHRIADR